MHPTKKDDELWFVQLYSKEVVIDTIPVAKKDIYKQRYIFEDYEDALQCQKHLQLAYFETFQHRPLIKIETIEQYLMELIEVELAVSEQLQEYVNFDGIDFVDVCANGIQVRGFHKQLLGMCFGSIFTIKYDFSNYKEVIKEFVEMWKARDNPEIIKMDNRFSDSCEKWGFN